LAAFNASSGAIAVTAEFIRAAKPAPTETKKAEKARETISLFDFFMFAIIEESIFLAYLPTRNKAMRKCEAKLHDILIPRNNTRSNQWPMKK
jgi:hypothetical protein